jgi:ADP-ribose pyrophosphatase YjhB (NUDIX family)
VSQPSTRVYGVALRGDEVLLVRSRNSFDDQKIWWLPGGGVDFRERIGDALRREFLEETGLDLRDAALLMVDDDERERPSGEIVHTVRIMYVVELERGDLVHEADGTTDMVAWVPLSQLSDRRLTSYATRAIEAALSARRGDYSVDRDLQRVLAATT